ncbi:MAG: S-layer homology domain-containing protein, partial [Clostridia bacterium]|nr:S-layer homology domain-containing protein [Clostridia bacterium]
MLKRTFSLLIAAVFLIALIPAAVSSEPLTMDFKDVPKTEWYYEYVKFVYENGLMVGTSATKFEPESSLTRGMFVTILCRIDGGTPET